MIQNPIVAKAYLDNQYVQVLKGTAKLMHTIIIFLSVARYDDYKEESHLNENTRCLFFI